MKRIILTALAIASLFTSGNLLAQETLETAVPFDFYFGRAAMPSGTYRIAPVGDHLLVMWHSTKGTSALQLAFPNGMERGEKGMLVFSKYGEKYFLSEVRGLPVSGRLALPVSPLEEELRGTVRTFETVTVPQPAEPQSK